MNDSTPFAQIIKELTERKSVEAELSNKRIECDMLEKRLSEIPYHSKYDVWNLHIRKKYFIVNNISEYKLIEVSGSNMFPVESTKESMAPQMKFTADVTVVSYNRISYKITQYVSIDDFISMNPIEISMIDYNVALEAVSKLNTIYNAEFAIAKDVISSIIPTNK